MRARLSWNSNAPYFYRTCLDLSGWPVTYSTDVAQFAHARSHGTAHALWTVSLPKASTQPSVT